MYEQSISENRNWAHGQRLYSICGISAYLYAWSHSHRYGGPETMGKVRIMGIIALYNNREYRLERKIYWLNKRIEAQQQEIDRLKHHIDNHIKWNEAHTKARVEQGELIDKLIKDKDEQAGTIMRLANGLKKLRSSLQWLKETIHDLDYKAWAEDNIGKIDALLGGKEDV